MLYCIRYQLPLSAAGESEAASSLQCYSPDFTNPREVDKLEALATEYLGAVAAGGKAGKKAGKVRSTRPPCTT